MFKGQWPSSRPSQKSLTFHAWSQLPGKANLFEQLSKLKRKKANKDQGGGGVGSGGSSHLLQSNKPEWSNSAAEKSVRFTLPPSEVKRRSRVVTFIPNTEAVVEAERPTFWDLRRNYSLETFDNCWTSQCPKCCQQCHSHNNNNVQGHPNQNVTNPAYHHEALPKRPSLRPSRKVLEILPDYTDDEQEAFIKPIPMSYPSGSMTLPKPAVKKQQQQTSQQQHHDMTKVKFSDNDKVTSSHDPKVTFCDSKVTFNDSKVTFKGLPTEEKVVTFRNNNNNLLPTDAIKTTEVVKKITPITITDKNNSQQVKFGDNIKVMTTSYDSKVTFKGLSPVVPSEDKVTFRSHSEAVVKKPTPSTTTTTTPAQDANSSQITKPHGESGESDPGYESDSSKSKPHEVTSVSSEQKQNSKKEREIQNSEQQHQKACTLPRRSAKVSVQPSSSTLDRRKLKSLADSEAGVTVEIISPIRLEHRDVAASQTLRAALSKVEQAHPGFSYDFVLGLVRKADANNVNMNESLLRLQGAVSDQDCIEYRSSRTEEPFQELNKKSVALKRILARIPEEISDRKTFLETIKEIASAIKKLLDAVNEVSAYIPGTSGKQALDQKKREFVKYSKRFSNTLKEFFRDGQPTPVFTSATYLIYQTNQVMITVKDKCE